MVDVNLVCCTECWLCRLWFSFCFMLFVLSHLGMGCGLFLAKLLLFAELSPNFYIKFCPYIRNFTQYLIILPMQKVVYLPFYVFKK